MKPKDKLIAVWGIVTGEIDLPGFLKVIDEQSELLRVAMEQVRIGQEQFDELAEFTDSVIKDAREYREMAHKAIDEVERLIRKIEHQNKLSERFLDIGNKSLDELVAQRSYIEQLSEQFERTNIQIQKLGRKRGSLSSASLEGGTRVDEIMPFLVRARAARARSDGSFAELCREAGHPESTVRDWLTRYAAEIEAATNST